MEQSDISYKHRVQVLKNRTDRKKLDFCDLSKIARINGKYGLPREYRDAYYENVVGFKFNIKEYFNAMN